MRNRNQSSLTSNYWVTSVASPLTSAAPRCRNDATSSMGEIRRPPSRTASGPGTLEHFQRTLFFLHHFAKDTPISGYLLPARPPMMNVLAAFFLGVTQDRFEIFQFVFTFLNLLVFLPCCLAI